MSALHVAIITHTTRHLRASLMGVAASGRRPDLVMVATDNDLPEIRDVVRECSGQTGLTLGIVQRAHAGASRSGQTRNNAVRGLMARGARDDDRVVFLDGDCCPAREALAGHEELGAGGRMVVGFRVELSEAQTASFDEAAVLRGEAPAVISSDQWATLRERERRYRRSLLLRRLGLAKPHKPKVLSANFSMPLALFRAINGFDEEFTGWGAEDDDLGRRVYDAGGKAAIGVTRCVVWHLWHPTRAPQAWDDIPGAERFKQRLPARCARGLEHPVDQAPRTMWVFEQGGETRTTTLDARGL